MPASMSRKRAIATAKGFLSTPWTEVRASGISFHLSVSPDCVLPGLQETVERTEEEVAAAAGGVDDAQAVREARVAMRGFGVQAELLDRGVERVLEDELLDELRGLKEGVRLVGVSRGPGRGRQGSGCSSRRRVKSWTIWASATGRARTPAGPWRRRGTA